MIMQSNNPGRNIFSPLFARNIHILVCSQKLKQNLKCRNWNKHFEEKEKHKGLNTGNASNLINMNMFSISSSLLFPTPVGNRYLLTSDINSSVIITRTFVLRNRVSWQELCPFPSAKHQHLLEAKQRQIFPSCNPPPPNTPVK